MRLREVDPGEVPHWRGKSYFHLIPLGVAATKQVNTFVGSMYFTQPYSANIRYSLPFLFYFGQPPVGFFFVSERLTAVFQLPLIFSTSGFGPGALAGLSFRFGLSVMVSSLLTACTPAAFLRQLEWRELYARRH